MRHVLYASIGMIWLVAGCGSDTNKELKPCPPKGIGVESADGTSCATATINQDQDKYKAAYADCLDQVSKFKNYQCIDPEICVDMGVRVVPGFSVDPMTSPQEVPFLITNCTASNKKLNISKMVIVGDKRCSYSEPEITTKVIDAGQGVGLRTVYKPKEPGVDVAGIVITSDAQNFKPLYIAICGRAMARFKPGLDSSTGDAGGGADLPTNKPLRCEDVTSQGVNKTCHKE